MTRAFVVDVCTSQRKGVAKRAVERVVLLENHGIEGDAHAGPGHRQISLLAKHDIDEMRAKGIDLRSGAFGENLVVSGVDTASLGIGTRLRVGAAEIEISQIGKVCHDRCAIYEATGDCIMPRTGLFASVRGGGLVRRGDAVEILRLAERRRGDLPIVTEERS